jgi:hypothetical protein
MSEITDMLDDEYGNGGHENERGPLDIIMMPPDGGDSDGDSDDSDSPAANINHLSKNLLVSGAEVVKEGVIADDEESLARELEKNENTAEEEDIGVDEEQNDIPVEIRSVRSDSESSQSGRSQNFASGFYSFLRGRGRGGQVRGGQVPRGGHAGGDGPVIARDTAVRGGQVRGGQVPRGGHAGGDGPVIARGRAVRGGPVRGGQVPRGGQAGRGGPVIARGRAVRGGQVPRGGHVGGDGPVIARGTAAVRGRARGKRATRGRGAGSISKRSRGVQDEDDNEGTGARSALGEPHSSVRRVMLDFTQSVSRIIILALRLQFILLSIPKRFRIYGRLFSFMSNKCMMLC